METAMHEMTIWGLVSDASVFSENCDADFSTGIDGKLVSDPVAFKCIKSSGETK